MDGLRPELTADLDVLPDHLRLSRAPLGRLLARRRLEDFMLQGVHGLCSQGWIWERSHSFLALQILPGCIPPLVAIVEVQLKPHSKPRVNIG
jgi:hypothetical protein